MPGIQDILTQQPPQGMPPQAPQQAQGTPQGGNPLAALSQQQQAPPPPPTRAQTVAAVHHFGQIKQAMTPIMADPNLGKSNIRPKVMDSFSKLLMSKVLSLPEIMKAVKSLPEDPVEQKKFVDKIYQDNDKAQQMVLQQHAMSPQPDQADEWSQDGHANHMASLMKNYGK